MDCAEVPAKALVALDVPDQQAAFQLAGIARRLTQLCAEYATLLVLTHAFEGGHPDHDACAFAVQAACGLMRRKGLPPPSVIEMPYYTIGETGWRVQQFGDMASPETVIHLRPDERRLKQAMLDAYVSQQDVLSLFPPGVERFRLSPGYDFTRLPNGGDLLYEYQHWGLTGSQWLQCTRAALRELGLKGAP